MLATKPCNPMLVLHFAVEIDTCRLSQHSPEASVDHIYMVLGNSPTRLCHALLSAVKYSALKQCKNA